MRLGIGDVFHSAVVALWRGGRPLAVCLVVWLGAEFVYSLVGHTNAPVAGLLFVEPMSLLLDVRSLDGPTFLFVLRVVSGGARILVGCVFMTAMLRILLLGAKAATEAGLGSLARAAGAVLLASLAVTLAVNAMHWLHAALVEFARHADWLGLAEAAVSVLYFIVLAYLAARLCLIFPSVSIGHGWALAQNLRRTAGNRIRLSAAFAIAALVGLAVSGLLDVVIFFRDPFATGGPSSGLFPPEGLPWRYWLLVAREIAHSVFPKMFLLTLSAVAYARLTAFPAANIPGAGRTPEELANAFE